MAVQVCFDYGAPLSAFGFSRCSQGHHTRREHECSDCQNQSAHGTFLVNSLKIPKLDDLQNQPELSQRYLNESLPERLTCTLDHEKNSVTPLRLLRTSSDLIIIGLDETRKPALR
jgi:hypothetical protein